MSDIDDVWAMALPLEYEADLDPLLDRIGAARCVLIGEASHGTHEYYAWRASLTRRLIAERGFSFVAVDGDWPDCRRVHRCVTGAAEAPDDPQEILGESRRWPTWMWANQETADFCRWLREHNAELPYERRAGFFGLDVYSLWESLRAVIVHLSEHRPEYVETALAAFRCFEPYGADPRPHDLDSRLVPDGCADEVLALLTRLRGPVAAADGAVPGDPVDPAHLLTAEVAAGAERYYRELIGGGARAWNARDEHMADTFDRLLDFHGTGARGIVWAHNSHVGDARATGVAAAGMVSLGRLARQRHGAGDVVLVGFAGGHGEVIAAPRWGSPMEVMTVPTPRAESVEALLAEAGVPPALFLTSEAPTPPWLASGRGHRAIGVVYDPTRETGSYVPTGLADRYDVMCWINRTSALRPLHLDAARGGELETLPSGV